MTAADGLGVLPPTTPFPNPCHGKSHISWANVQELRRGGSQELPCAGTEPHQERARL